MFILYIFMIVLLDSAIGNDEAIATKIIEESPPYFPVRDRATNVDYDTLLSSFPTDLPTIVEEEGHKICPANETYVQCKVGCPNNYCPKDDSRAIVVCDPAYPCPGGCVCKGNYLRLSNKNTRCILAKECPPVKCHRSNEEWNSCPSPCLAERCEDKDRPQKKCDKAYSYCQPQCVCKEGYFRNQSDVCVPACNCPKTCSVSNECRRTCADPNPENCPYTKPPKANEDGCQCQAGYILSEKGGSCIKIEDCPKGCKGDPHAVAKECPVPCPATCDQPEPMLTCKRKCDPLGCQCEPGYILCNGKCILPDDCKGGNPCGKNAFFSSCKSSCPTDYCPVDDSRARIICEYYPFSPCYPGCICKINHKRKSREDKRCIVSSDCPPVNCTRPNEEWSSCPSACLAESCEDVDNQPITCNTLLLNCEPKCICKPKTFRNSSDICVPAKECPKKEPVCGYNEEYVKCRTICPPQSCEISYTEYACGPEKCEPGCDCIKNHLRNSSGICILNDDCPPPAPVCLIPSECRPTCANRNPQNCAKPEPASTNIDGCQCQKGYILSETYGKCIRIKDCPQDLPKCGYNEKAVACKQICPPQQCGVNPAVVRCKKTDCLPGCDCIEGHLRNESGICIPSNQCLPKCGNNEKPSLCKIKCPPQQCGVNPAVVLCLKSDCEPGCDCIDGHLRNDRGECIPREQCSNCTVPRKCRPTCAVPNPKNCPYIEPPTKNVDGCQCQKGYVLSESNGKCVKVEECPQDLGCNDDPNAVIKAYPWPCPSTCDAPNTIQCRKASPPLGCQCRPGYLLSSINGKCVLPDECKNGNPCGVNGTFSDCGFRCPDQYCPQNDNRSVYACKPSRPCPPGCLCKENYKRKSYQDNTCVLASDCQPVCGYNEEYVKCRTICPPQSCESSYTEYACGPKKCEPGCDCIKNHLRNSSGICIRNDDCPPPAPVCPIPNKCRPTCANRNPQNCAKPEPASTNIDGCQCQKGYILSETYGKCIRIKDCPQDLPKCGYNEKAVACKQICPPQKCGVNPATVSCTKTDCLPGCDCVEGHLRNESGICIPRNQCLPKCGHNEKPSLCKIKCPPQQCGVNPAVVLCLKSDCEPGCDCIDGHLRNDRGECIPREQCSNCTVPRKCRPTCAIPNPKNCRYTEPPTSNVDGCQCQKGYVLSESDGKCVKVEDCPQDLGCNDDPNAVIKAYPWPCPSTCDAPNTIQCFKASPPLGCQCRPGYLLSSINGKCVLPDECKNGNPCGVNGTFSDCGFRCPDQYCPQNDDRTVYACKPGRPCPPGCLCKENYKRKSDEDNTCILASDCPPVTCTRPNEVWNSCSQCYAERCDELNKPILCDDLPGTNCNPKCVCKPGYYRDANDTCIYEKDCPNQCPVSRKCRQTCANRNPANCGNCKPPKENDDGCQCKKGYILSELDGKCIKVEDCPC